MSRGRFTLLPTVPNFAFHWSFFLGPNEKQFVFDHYGQLTINLGFVFSPDAKFMLKQSNSWASRIYLTEWCKNQFTACGTTNMSHHGMNPVLGSFCTVTPQIFTPFSSYSLMNFAKYKAHALWYLSPATPFNVPAPCILPLVFIHAGAAQGLPKNLRVLLLIFDADNNKGIFSLKSSMTKLKFDISKSPSWSS